MSFKSMIRSIPDHPKPGIIFRDMTTILKDPKYFQELINDLTESLHSLNIVKVAGIEARGFTLGGAVAAKLGAGFIPIRKAGKLPWNTIGCDYQLEYGAGRLEVHTDAVELDERVALIDDLVATGGTAGAAVDLLQQLGGQIVACNFAIELKGHGGMEHVQSIAKQPLQWNSLCQFD